MLVHRDQFATKVLRVLISKNSKIGLKQKFRDYVMFNLRTKKNKIIIT